MTRQKFEQRKLLLRGQEQVDRAIALLRTVPLDDKKPLEVLVREEVKARKLDQQGLMWAGPLKDLSEQAWIEQRQYSPEVWHEFCKKEFLPEELDPELCLEGYRKWDFDPAGDRVLVGSTTMLTVKGMAWHITQIHALGGSLGVEFHEAPPRG
ncbi:recombination protein NinB [Duganella sp. BJB475]|uniref:recombination protein NinB n=1 Tax=Duganella sp. BJB475 TaxID=2233914 RepID=UPI000E3570D3|nr:recombination protein NinB [Duganella sp. BJB475]RFP19135.1 hypothetical protein D0T23_04955 [Duganella sp. BJB475]